MECPGTLVDAGRIYRGRRALGAEAHCDLTMERETVVERDDAGVRGPKFGSQPGAVAGQSCELRGADLTHLMVLHRNIPVSTKLRRL